MDPAAQLSQLLIAAGIPISGVSQPSAGVFVIQFSGNETEAQLTQANSILSSFTPSPSPNLSGFKLAILQDSTMPSGSLLEVTKFAYSVQDLIYSPQALQGLWTDIKANDSIIGGNSVCTDGTLVSAKIEGYASQYNIPLVTS